MMNAKEFTRMMEEIIVSPGQSGDFRPTKNIRRALGRNVENIFDRQCKADHRVSETGG